MTGAWARLREAPGAALVLATVLLPWLSGCDSDGAAGPDLGTGVDLAVPGDLAGVDLALAGDLGPGQDQGTPSVSLAPAAATGDFTHPLDAVPTADGTTFYFTASSSAGEGVFKVGAAGGGVTTILAGSPFVAPFGIAISKDDATLFVADPGAVDGNESRGAIYRLGSSGAGVAAVAGTAGRSPRGLEVAGDTLYFSGVDPSDGAAGVFQVPVAGGAITPLAKGAPFADPSGIAVAASGELFVTDTGGVIFKVSGGTATELIAGLPVGYPAGLALTMDGTKLLVSGQERDKRTSVVFVVDLATKAVTSYDVQGSADSGGLHRARNASVFSWCGVTAGAQGTVFNVTLF